MPREESLRLSRGFEPSQVAFPLSGEMVRAFGPVVRILAVVVNGTGHHGAVCGGIAPPTSPPHISWDALIERVLELILEASLPQPPYPIPRALLISPIVQGRIAYPFVLVPCLVPQGLPWNAVWQGLEPGKASIL